MTPSYRNALAVLVANEAAAEVSFLYALHERDRFDAAAFWELFDAMAVIAAAPPRQRAAARRAAAFVHRAILMHVIHHLSPHDGSRIRRCPGRRLQAYLDRLDWVFVPVTDGTRGYGPAPDVDDGLRRPQPRRTRTARRTAPRTRLPTSTA
ncbi:MAG: hypothetical protein HXX10_00675 [Rhodoplanes sp.]|uniref:hypothetical protein n=1 Tax=Rhodoplanes sp. TaxID=1968906 RepID=UPI0017AA29C7|nr:hypothetical protein [Rhodoplanes sp.]NVO12529.1 hypothetical protein [Rhodoplanes sp.]